MRIVGIVCAYDEHPSWLSVAVSGFAQVCDDIVYCDGAYVLYPQGKPRSHIMQSEAVTAACEAAGVGCVAYRPREVWFGNEVEKRNLSLSLAGTLSPDWVLVFDADYHVSECSSEMFRAELEATDLNVATYRRWDTDDEGNQWSNRERAIYRWTADLIYGPAHWTISGTYAGKMEWLRGPEHVLESSQVLAPALDLNSLSCTHRNRDRLKERSDDALTYAKIRDFYDVEKVDPELFLAPA